MLKARYLILAAAAATLCPRHTPAADALSVDSLASFERIVDGLRRMAWQMQSASAALGADQLGRTVIDDLNEFGISSSVDVELNALSERLHSEAAGPTGKPAAPTLDEANRLLRTNTLGPRWIAEYWTVQVSFMRHRKLLASVLEKLSGEERAAFEARRNEVESEFDRGFTPRVDLESATDLQTQRLNLLHARDKAFIALNQVRTEALKKVDMQAGSALPAAEVIHRDGECPAPAAKTSGRDTPALDLELSPSTDSFYEKTDSHDGVEGIVQVTATISKTGCMEEVFVRRSSGVPSLDHAAIEWTKSARFLPADVAGEAHAGTLTFNVRFRLT